MNARLSPQDWSRRAYPVFAGTFWRENINRGAILRMHRNGAINSTQVRHKIVQVGIVLLGKRTHLGLINYLEQGEKALLKVSLAWNILAASSSLVLVGTREARSKSRIDTTPLTRQTRPLLFRLRVDGSFADSEAPAESSSLCVSTSSADDRGFFFLQNGD